MRKNQNLTEKLTVKITAGEKEEIKKKAEESGSNISEYLRPLILRDEVSTDPKRNCELRNRLLGIGNEIGQLKAKQKTGKTLKAEDFEQLEKGVYEICHELIL